MLQQLKFVQGAISTKDFIPALTHFAIDNGRVRGYNGTLALCSPLSLDIDCKPEALPLIKAIANCNDTVQMSLTPTGRLAIKSGSFKAFINCIDQETPHVEPEGEPLEIDGAALLEAFKCVLPFISNDASRQWSNGVLLDGESVFATNNITAVEYWVGVKFPYKCNVPRSCIKEMLRIGKPPLHAQITETSITFHYDDNCWIRTQLFGNEWPDLRNILAAPSNALPFNELLFPALDKLKPFVDKLGRVYFADNVVSTSLVDNEGASNEIHIASDGLYNIEILNLLKGIVTHIDWSLYPAACMFFGDRLRGALIGMKK